MARPAKMLGEVLGSLGKKPATVRYPFAPSEPMPNFRGEVRFSNPDACIGCKLCVRDCPSGAIHVAKYDNGSFRLSYKPRGKAGRETVEIPSAAKKRAKARFRVLRCIFCAQCVESCPRKALTSSAYFELARLGANKAPENR
jgi:formate hydrogenlyase subunit 6/NADH:ubiquinone oxidoreductase subunit I